MSLWLESRALHGRRPGGSRERLPQGKLMRTLGGSLREKQKRRESEETRIGKGKEEEEEETKTEP